MKKWDNRCTECKSKKVHQDAIDIYYDRNPSIYYCDDCGAEITVEMCPVVKKVNK